MQLSYISGRCVESFSVDKIGNHELVSIENHQGDGKGVVVDVSVYHDDLDDSE